MTAHPAPAQLPAVPWVFIHGQPGGIGSIQLTRRSAADDDLEIDGEGRWSYGSQDPEELRGLVAQANREEVEWAASRALRVHAVVATDRSVLCDGNDRVVVDGVDPYLDGTYTITEVRPTPVHLRILLRRTEGADG